MRSGAETKRMTEGLSQVDSLDLFVNFPSRY